MEVVGFRHSDLPSDYVFELASVLEGYRARQCGLRNVRISTGRAETETFRSFFFFSFFHGQCYEGKRRRQDELGRNIPVGPRLITARTAAAAPFVVNSTVLRPRFRLFDVVYDFAVHGCSL